MLTARSVGCSVGACSLVAALLGCSAPAPVALHPTYNVLPPAPTAPRLADNQVVQRDAQDEGTLACTGLSDVDGAVLARVACDADGGLLHDWHLVGLARDGTYAAAVRHLAVGGPYRVELAVRGPDGVVQNLRSAQHVLVGDIWVLAGQSNMEGQGDMVDVESPSPWVCSYGLNEHWTIAAEPLHWLSEALDPIHHLGETADQIATDLRTPRASREKGAGLGLAFAKELYARTGVPIGLLPCAHRGTSMDQWDPVRKPLGGWSLYGSMLRRVAAVGGHVRGVLWYQGEEDTRPEDEKDYRYKFERFIAAVRRDFGDPRLPFYIVQLGRRIDYPQADDAWSSVREQQRRVAEEVPAVDAVAAVDLPLDDEIHIGTRGLKQLGRRLALVAYHDLFDPAAVRVGPRLRRVVLEDPARGLVRVYYDDVNGQLRPDAHVAGFCLRGPDGKPGPELYDVRVDPHRPNTVLCLARGPVSPGTCLWYGYGRNPYCNLVDEQNLAAPAFGPIPLGLPDVQHAAAARDKPALPSQRAKIRTE